MMAIPRQRLCSKKRGAEGRYEWGWRTTTTMMRMTSAIIFESSHHVGSCVFCDIIYYAYYCYKYKLSNMPQTTCRHMDVLLLMWSAMKMSVEVKCNNVMHFVDVVVHNEDDNRSKWWWHDVIVFYQCHCWLLRHSMWDSMSMLIDLTTMQMWRWGFDCCICICGKVAGVSWLQIMTVTICWQQKDYDMVSTWQQGFDHCICTPDHDDDNTTMIRCRFSDRWWGFDCCISSKAAVE